MWTFWGADLSPEPPTDMYSSDALAYVHVFYVDVVGADLSPEPPVDRRQSAQAWATGMPLQGHLGQEWYAFVCVCVCVCAFQEVWRWFCRYKGIWDGFM
jgi:hypothetical protein